MLYVIEHQGCVYGPFAPDDKPSGRRGDEKASEWALKHCSGDWRLRQLREPAGAQ